MPTEEKLKVQSFQVVISILPEKIDNFYLQKYNEKLAKEKLHTEVLDTQLKFSIRHYCYGSVGMTKEWLLYNNTTSAEVVVEMMFNSMPKALYACLLSA